MVRGFEVEDSSFSLESLRQGCRVSLFRVWCGVASAVCHEPLVKAMLSKLGSAPHLC